MSERSKSDIYILGDKNLKKVKRCNVPYCNGKGNLKKNLKTHTRY